jgi:hypothetical protein
MKRIIPFASLSLFLIHCGNNNDLEGLTQLQVSSDSIMVKKAITQDSLLFNSLYLRTLTNFKENVSDTVILKDDEVIIKRFYYKNKMRLFNYFLVSSKDTSFVISFNFIFNFERAYELNKADSIGNKIMISNLTKTTSINSDLNSLNSLLHKTKGSSFKEVFKLLIQSTQTIHLVNKSNFPDLFDYKKYKEMNCQKEKVEENKIKIENAIKDNNTIVGYLNNVFFSVKVEEGKINTDFYFQDVAHGWYL